jgi:hypothetical protein
MPKDSYGKTGSAEIVRVGHSTDGRFGTDPGFNGPSNDPPERDLKAFTTPNVG